MTNRHGIGPKGITTQLSNTFYDLNSHIMYTYLITHTAHDIFTSDYHPSMLNFDYTVRPSICDSSFNSYISTSPNDLKLSTPNFDC